MRVPRIVTQKLSEKAQDDGTVTLMGSFPASARSGGWAICNNMVGKTTTTYLVFRTHRYSPPTTRR
jgi:hypothetical protein